MSASNRGMPVQQGAISGGVMFIVGLVVTFIVGTLGLSTILGLLVGFSPINGTIIGYLYMHLWPLVLGAQGIGSILVFTIIPIILLLIGGYWVASGSSGNGFTNGASITVGYFILTLILMLYLSLVASGGSQINMQLNLDFFVALIFTGIIFPVVFGGIGGILADEM